MAITQPPTAPSTSAPRRAVWLFFLLFLTGLCARGYGDYNQTRLHDPATFTRVLDGTAAAPEQYRIGVIFTADFLSRHLHLTLSQTFAILDILAAMLAVILLFDILEHTSTWTTASPTLRWFGAAAFAALAVYAFDWAGWYHRPTTLPTTGLVALLVWLWTPRRAGFSLNQLLTAAAILLTALAQSFIRADIVVALFAGFFLTSLFGRGQLAFRRLPSIGLSLLGIVLGAATQGYLARVRYPQATYGRVPVFMFFHDYRGWAMWMSLLIFIAPLLWVIWTLTQSPRTPTPLTGTTPALLLGAILYLGLWILLGRLDEVRIFLPMSLATLPLTVTLAMQRAGVQMGSSAP